MLMVSCEKQKVTLKVKNVWNKLKEACESGDLEAIREWFDFKAIKLEGNSLIKGCDQRNYPFKSLL